MHSDTENNESDSESGYDDEYDSDGGNKSESGTAFGAAEQDQSQPQGRKLGEGAGRAAEIESREIASTPATYPLVRPITGSMADELMLSYSHVLPLVNAYSVVSEYGRAKRRIFTGGMAIDLALKTRGGYIYDGFDIDFDFFSPEYHKDAYEQAQILVRGKENNHVNAIVAMHPGTMRVRYNWQVLADITYVHKPIYDKIPTLETRGYRIVHPCFQMIDQHIVLSQPYSNEPFVNLRGRYKKDFTRYLKLAHYFSIAEELPKILGKPLLQRSEGKADERYVEIDVDLLLGQCISGIHALRYWQAAEKYDTKRATAKPGDSEEPEETLEFIEPSLDKKMRGTKGEPTVKRISIRVPAVILSNDYIACAKKISERLGVPIKWYNTLLDKIPRRAMVGDIEIQDNRHKWVAAEKVSATNTAINTGIGLHIGANPSMDTSNSDSIYVAGIHTAAISMLAKAVMLDDVDSAAAYVELYELFIHSIESKNNRIALLATMYGTDKMADARVMMIRKFCKTTKKIPVEQLIAKNYYPGKRDPNYDFNPAESNVFDYDGAETTEPEHADLADDCEGLLEGDRLYA